MGALILTAGKVRPDTRHPGSLLVDVTIAFGDLPTVHGWAEMCIDDEGVWHRTDLGPSGAGWLSRNLARWLTPCDKPVRAAILRAVEGAAAAAIMPVDARRASRELDAYLASVHEEPMGTSRVLGEAG